MKYLFFLLISISLFADDVLLDLQNPTYSQGMIHTTEGGIVSTTDLRIQALRISYAKGDDLSKVEAEEQVILQYGCFLLIGERIEYDFVTGEGILYQGRSGLPPWYFGGEKIYLLPSHEIEIVNGYITTSESMHPEWSIKNSFTRISENHDLKAQDVKFTFFDIPIFWLPKLEANLDTILDSPIRYRVRWGGDQGFRLGMLYEFYLWHNMNTCLRFDYRWKKGPGGGIETHYDSHDRKKRFHTINYIARDASIDDSKEKTRYRFQGLYNNTWDCGRTGLNVSYDKVSDQEMPTDYQDKGLVIKDADRTLINLRRQQDELFVTNFTTAIRVNSFETLKQELPTFNVVPKTILLGKTGIYSQSMMELSYLNFAYTDNLKNTGGDYSSARFLFQEKLYRSYHYRAFTATPELGGVAIFYNKTPIHMPGWVTLTSIGGELKADFYKIFGSYKHVIEPSVRYQWVTNPLSPNDHFIFDISDGWYGLQTLRFGLKQLLFEKMSSCLIHPTFTWDLYTYGYPNTHTWGETFPRAYTRLEWFTTTEWKNSCLFAWDFERQEASTYNFMTEITFDENVAFAAEYRQRSPFAWRAVDPDNFILQAFRTEPALRNSLVSDRRKTLLCHAFYRFEPNWALDVELRHGWDRFNEPHYTEYAVNFITNLRSHWKMRMAYEHLENDHRIAFYFSLGPNIP